MIQFKINGKSSKFMGDPEMPLLWFLATCWASPAPSTAVAWDSAARAPST